MKKIIKNKIGFKKAKKRKNYYHERINHQREFKINLCNKIQIKGLIDIIIKLQFF